ncbi:MAG: universal stress protein [Actinomycetes bacterium]
MNEVVVGIDGSEHALQALRWAVGEARRRGAPLRAVHAWVLPYMPLAVGYMPLDEGKLLEASHEGANAVVQAALGAAADEAADIDMAGAAVNGPPVAVLLAQAKEAALLVVGSRGHGGFAELMLGSVSHQCAQHARCPVVIVPATR